MGDLEQFVEQQFIASEAVVILDKMIDGMTQLEQLCNSIYFYIL